MKKQHGDHRKIIFVTKLIDHSDSDFKNTNVIYLELFCGRNALSQVTDMVQSFFKLTFFRMMNELKEKRKLYIDSVGKMEFESKEVKMQLFRLFVIS